MAVECLAELVGDSADSILQVESSRTLHTHPIGGEIPAVGIRGVGSIGDDTSSAGNGIALVAAGAGPRVVIGPTERIDQVAEPIDHNIPSVALRAPRP